MTSLMTSLMASIMISLAPPSSSAVEVRELEAGLGASQAAARRARQEEAALAAKAVSARLQTEWWPPDDPHHHFLIASSSRLLNPERAVLGGCMQARLEESLRQSEARALTAEQVNSARPLILP